MLIENSVPIANGRRVPRQARSRATVGNIVQAGAAVLSARGWFGFTTNEVVEVAGVGTATLYQYFPNKDALVEAVGRQHFDQALQMLLRPVVRKGGLRNLVNDFVQDMIVVHSIDPWLHRVLLDSPAPGAARSSRAAFMTEYLGGYEIIIAASRGRRQDAANDTAVQVLSSAVEGVIYNAVRRGLLKSPELRAELTTLVYGYLSSVTVPVAMPRGIV
ncbi:TetR/AcrR family transcriptional regulator [Inquilinus sp.]|jgi:AcrR family transcriptional regulator|uniref:TetR/AcrR family transcriptional regulator n=1 Tax=Inquilinus sp. TaxID=1932117 RepID=UPI003784E6E0